MTLKTFSADPCKIMLFLGEIEIKLVNERVIFVWNKNFILINFSISCLITKGKTSFFNISHFLFMVFFLFYKIRVPLSIIAK